MYREGNQAANFLAKLSTSSSDEDCVWESPSGGLEFIFLVDSAGVFT